MTANEDGRPRAYEGLARITERHATGEDRERWESLGRPMAPYDALLRVSDLASGSAFPEEGAPAVDEHDITAALALLPLARAEFDQLELGLLRMAKGRGLTWQQIGSGLGLGSAQAARQRHDRIARRARDGA
ncbi:hypothetical protein [Nocardiopsis potens]|uniref:hypothetical protein n=1 Tax=Nocardiopsis potens TaxID=1246458 RepID=UPI00034D73A3|nr:hypothetical protein [Nocardiopsis potens]